MTQRDHKFGGAHTEEAVPGSIHSLWSRKEKKLPKMALENTFEENQKLTVFVWELNCLLS